MRLRWLFMLVFAALLTTSSTADAQAFKPRGGAKTEKAPAKKPAKKAAPKKATKRTAKKAPPREPEVVKSEPDEDSDDYVVIEDE